MAACDRHAQLDFGGADTAGAFAVKPVGIEGRRLYAHALLNSSTVCVSTVGSIADLAGQLRDRVRFNEGRIVVRVPEH